MKFQTGVFSLLLVLFSIQLISAQGSPRQNQKNLTPEEDRAQKEIERLASKLDLDETQKSEVYDIALKYATQRKALKDETQDRKKLRELLQQQNEAKKTELQQVLSPEQWQEFQELEKRKSSRKGRSRQ